MNPLHVGALVALVLALWAIDHTTSENAHLADQLASLQRDESRNAQLIQQQAAALAQRDALADRVAAIQSGLGALGRDLRARADENAQAMEELKRNDQEVREWMAGCVPAAVGVRYARPTTTDPRAYRAPESVPAVGVPAAGSPCGPGQ